MESLRSISLLKKIEYIPSTFDVGRSTCPQCLDSGVSLIQRFYLYADVSTKQMHYAWQAGVRRSSVSHSIRLAALLAAGKLFRPAAALICHNQVRAFIRSQGGSQDIPFRTSGQDRYAHISLKSFRYPSACGGVVNFKPLFKVFKIDL